MLLVFFTIIFQLFFLNSVQDCKILSSPSVHGESLVILRNDSVFTLDPVTLKTLSAIKLDTLLTSVDRYHAISSPSKLFLLANGSGEIRTIDGAQNHRIDHSNMINFQINAAIFKHRDTLFKFGGYGYWSASRNMTFWDQTTKEWELYSISSESELPPPSFDYTSFYSDNKFRILSGKILDSINPTNDMRISMPYTFDFNSKSWQKTTTGNDYYFGFEYSSDTISLLLQEDQIIVFDWKNNLKKIYNSNLVDEVDLSQGIAVINQTVFFMKRNTSDRTLHQVALKDFLGTQVESNTIYKSKISDSYSLILFGLFLVGTIGLILFFKRKKVIRIKSNYLHYNNRLLQIPESTLGVLVFIANNPTFKTNDLYDLLYNPSLHPNHVYKVISYELKKIEDLLKIITGTNAPVFVKSKFNKDRRITIISLQLKDYPLQANVT